MFLTLVFLSESLPADRKAGEQAKGAASPSAGTCATTRHPCGLLSSQTSLKYVQIACDRDYAPGIDLFKKNLALALRLEHLSCPLLSPVT